MLARLWITAGIAFGALSLNAQPASPPRSFEAAVVKPSKEWTPFRMDGGPGSRDPGQIVYTGVTLADIVRQAYDLWAWQLKGPSWLDSEPFEATAKVPQGASKQDLRVMLQRLLAERFQLAVHRETHEGRNYRLVVDKGGPKLKPPTNGVPPGHGAMEADGSGSLQIPANAMGRPVALSGKSLVALVSGGNVLILANSQTVSALADKLALFMDGPVQDLTGLTGPYDFSLYFALPAGARSLQRSPAGENAAPPSNAEPPLTIFQALKERLGLRLDTVRGPIDMLVVDHAEKAPTEN